jgi:hypothetical protein
MDFDAAVAKSKECKNPSNDDKLALYKYFKQVRLVAASHFFSPRSRSQGEGCSLASTNRLPRAFI